MDQIKQIQISKQGYEALKKELDNLVEIKRPKVVRRLEFAREQGDLSENSDYQNARDELEFLEGRIDELRHVIDNAKIVSGSNGKTNQVAFGTKVTVSVNGRKLVFEIVGEWESDPMKQKISHESPLGKALVGRKVGDEVEVEAPAGKIVYKILSIE